jgi:DNA mismatch repair protein MLH3
LSYVNPGDDDDENGVVRTDPSSSVAFILDKRPDQLYPCTSSSQEFDEDSAQTISTTRRTITVPDSDDREAEPPSWILDALKDNSAYFVREKPIPSVSQRLPNLLILSSELVAPACATHPSRHVDSLFTLDKPSTWCLQKDDLTRMKVLNQLDRKFIVCTVDEIRGSDDNRQEPDIPRRMLVLVDQHAASERVRVEGFLRTLCHRFLNLESNGSQSADRVDLDPPRAILLSRREASILRNTQSILGRWCFELSWPESEGCDQSFDQDKYERFLVHSVPGVVSEKLLAGDELRDFLREYAAEAETDGILPALGTESGGDPDHLTWHKALRWCPKGLLGLINSRACRGAIMFNDSLSNEQCERLMSQLAETAFPFQCAHGRPSLVPLTGTSESAFGQGQRRKVDWERSGSMLASLGMGSSPTISDWDRR